MRWMHPSILMLSLVASGCQSVRYTSPESAAHGARKGEVHKTFAHSFLLGAIPAGSIPLDGWCPETGVHTIRSFVGPFGYLMTGLSLGIWTPSRVKVYCNDIPLPVEGDADDAVVALGEALISEPWESVAPPMPVPPVPPGPPVVVVPPPAPPAPLVAPAPPAPPVALTPPAPLAVAVSVTAEPLPVPVAETPAAEGATTEPVAAAVPPPVPDPEAAPIPVNAPTLATLSSPVVVSAPGEGTIRLVDLRTGEAPLEASQVEVVEVPDGPTVVIVR